MPVLEESVGDAEERGDKEHAERNDVESNFLRSTAGVDLSGKDVAECNRDKNPHTHNRGKILMLFLHRK